MASPANRSPVIAAIPSLAARASSSACPRSPMNAPGGPVEITAASIPAAAIAAS